MDVAANLIGGKSKLDRVSGSVYLAGVLLNDVEARGLWPSTIRDKGKVDGDVDKTSEVEFPPGPATDEVPLSKRLAYLLQPPTDLLLSQLGPLEWHGTLFDYQMEGIRALITHDALLLADDMGLGKTIQAVGALRLLTLQRRIESALLIVRAGLIDQWRRELRRWAPELRVCTIRGPVSERAWQWKSPAHVYLVSYETLRSDFTENPHSPPRRIWDVVVLDEAQAIKNRETETSVKCKRLHRRRAWALTGTPLENRVEDLASILEFTTPFRPGDKPTRISLGPGLLATHKRLQLRRRKADVLPQLPPKTVSKIMLKLEPAQRESYDLAEREGVFQLRGKGDTVRVENVLELILRLKQICNFCPTTGQSAKLADMLERIRVLESEGHRALVFCQFTDERHGVQAIARALELPEVDENGDELRLQPLVYTGELSSADKEATLREFTENPERKVLVLSLRAGGQGLNLQQASYVFHFDRWWNPAIENQAEDRSHRIGQTFPVNVYKYTCDDTIEERIDHILQGKQRLFDELVDDVSIDLKARLTSEELFGLFGLAPPEQAKSKKRAQGISDYSVMTGVEFEEHVKLLLERRGWSVEMTPRSRDGGIDLIASHDDDIGLRTTLFIQCKNHASSVGVEVVRELNGVLPQQLAGARGVLVCPSGFTADAIAFARDREIHLWDRSHLFELTV